MKFRSGKQGSVYVIAEVGINHNGNLDHAKNLIRLASEAGADGVKIQVRDLAEIYSREVLEDPLKAEQGTQYLLSELKKAHLTYEDVLELQAYARQFPVDFFATPFDIKSAHFLNTIGMELYKIGSPDFTNLPLLETVCSFNKPIILSTGMSDETEIDQVITYLRKKNADFSLLHCNSTYPASYEDINLRYLPVLKQTSKVMVGYSGHEQGYGPTLAAVGLGAEIIERHITEDRTHSGPDHSASLEFDQFKQMVAEIRRLELTLGQPHRTCSQGERNNRLSLAKSLVAATDLKAGTVIGPKDLAAKTPAKGVSPLRFDEFVGQVLNRDLKKDEYIFDEHLTKNVGFEKSIYDINRHWGIVGRLNDFRDFIDLKPKLIEIHMTWRDLFSYKPFDEKFSQDLIIHAPEYYQDKLIDFTSEDSSVTEYSIEMLQKTIDIARSLDSSFEGQTDSRGPRVIVHPGGHFSTKKNSDRKSQYALLKKHLRQVNTDGVRLLVENMPPFPWYFGGQWYNTIFMDPVEISEFAKDMGWGICFDTSHALLYCNSAGISLRDFSRTVFDHVAYLHVSDAKGTTEEGLQLGMGDMTREDLVEILGKLNVGFIPEIWQGHLNKGKGFKDALVYIEQLLMKSSGKSCPIHGNAHGENDCPDLQNIRSQLTSR